MGNAFQASSGASQSDTWANLTGSYTHNSDDRNQIWSAKASVSSEYDYFSLGFGGSYTRLFNEKNTELKETMSRTEKEESELNKSRIKVIDKIETKIIREDTQHIIL